MERERGRERIRQTDRNKGGRQTNRHKQERERERERKRKRMRERERAAEVCAVKRRWRWYLNQRTSPVTNHFRYKATSTSDLSDVGGERASHPLFNHKMGRKGMKLDVRVERTKGKERKKNKDRLEKKKKKVQQKRLTMRNNDDNEVSERPKPATSHQERSREHEMRIVLRHSLYDR